MKSRKIFKRITSKYGVDDFFRQTYVEANRIGERLAFALTGHPDPSTAIVLAGSGRSGTTWLEEVLCALPGVQPIFEPLHPLFNEEVRRLTGYGTQDPYFRAWYLRPDEEQPEWTVLLEKVLTGRIRNYWTDYERKTIFPKRFLIKDVRSNMYLGYLCKRFHPRLIYILRHPCAVVNSRLIAPHPWHASVNDLLSQSLLVRDYLEPWQSEIKQEEDSLGAHALWWAVENRVALDQLRQIPHFLIYYEQMVMYPEQVVEVLLSWLGYDDVPEKLLKTLSKPSRMSHSNLKYEDTQARLCRWQDSLSISGCHRILTWARRFGLEMYDERPLPIHMDVEAEVLQ